MIEILDCQSRPTPTREKRTAKSICNEPSEMRIFYFMNMDKEKKYKRVRLIAQIAIAVIGIILLIYIRRITR
jgi:hypothetical protein